MMTKMKYCNALYVVRQQWAFSGCRAVMLVNFIWHDDDDDDNDDDDDDGELAVKCGVH